MSLTEPDAVQMAAALEDYELVSVKDLGGNDECGYWLHVNDERFGLDCEIASHADYWDFISYFAAGQRWPVKPLSEVA